jgi:hypothetical protein
VKLKLVWREAGSLAWERRIRVSRETSSRVVVWRIAKMSLGVVAMIGL